jgi:GPH family glycoside/pentoside/hexuronide:cation symporter
VIRELLGRADEDAMIAVIEKTAFAFAFGVGLVGVYLGYAHYMPTKNGQLITQPASAITSL